MIKFGIVDRVFEWIEKRKWFVFSISVLLLALAFWFRKPLEDFSQPYQSFFKLLALIVGPFATIVGFYLGFKAKEELVSHSNDAQDKLTRLAAESDERMSAQAATIEAKSHAIGVLETQMKAAAADLSRSEAALSENVRILATERERVTKLDENLRRVTDGGHNLWKAYDARPFVEYDSWLRAPDGAKIITVGNLKGGVGKTTIAANLAAYISKKPNSRVLVIDLDYQGSLSNMMMYAAGKEEVPSNADMLLLNEPTLSTLADAVVHLSDILPNAWLVPASYTLGSVEGRILLGWLMEPNQEIDARYRLARILLNPDVRKRYEAIILDMPPRLTLGSVNAIVASHYLIVPSALDRMSTEALRQFLVVARAIKDDLKLDIELLGAVGTLSRSLELSKREKLAWKRIGEHCEAIWSSARDHRFVQTIPRKEKIAEAAGEGIAYLATGAGANDVRKIFDALGDEVWGRIFDGLKRPPMSSSSPQSEHETAPGTPPESI
jgi:cellulose biosynthesis protein BcsQ